MNDRDIKLPSNKSFAIVFFIVFLLIGFYPLLKGYEIRSWSLIVSIIILILGLTNSKFLTPFNKLWFKFGIFLGRLISPLVMGLIFFVVVTPIAILMRILKKDLLNLNFNNKIATYWIDKTGPKSKMKNQF
tara:strand:+ start:215 stop:607 length:393 start_codon:yes stop_codon:yes gene_type:complete